MVLNDLSQITASRQRILLGFRWSPVVTLLFTLAAVVTNKTSKPQTFVFPGHEIVSSFSEKRLDRNRHPRRRIQNLTEISAILFLSSVWPQCYSEGQHPSVAPSTGLHRIWKSLFSTVYNLDMFVRNLKLILSTAIFRELREIFV